ncbi:MAG: hypothetical protein LBS57_12850, partial [Treponema sp.]|nr:hypothetical protein [Treponema sp.]
MKTKLKLMVLFCTVLLSGCTKQEVPQTPPETAAMDGTGSVTVISDVAGMVLIDGEETGTRVKSNGTVTINNILNGDTEVAVKLDDGTTVRAAAMVPVKSGETAQIHIAAPVIVQAEPVETPAPVPELPAAAEETARPQTTEAKAPQAPAPKPAAP